MFWEECCHSLHTQVICQDAGDGFLIVDPVSDNVFITCGATFSVLNVRTKIVV